MFFYVSILFKFCLIRILKPFIKLFYTYHSILSISLSLSLSCSDVFRKKKLLGLSLITTFVRWSYYMLSVLLEHTKRENNLVSLQLWCKCFVVVYLFIFLTFILNVLSATSKWLILKIYWVIYAPRISFNFFLCVSLVLV